MANLKLVKSATALVLGASVLTSAVVASGTDASAKTTYKVNKKGTLVNAKTNKTVKGYKSYKGKLYKNGKKLTGLYNKRYYKKGVKATGTYKGAYYVKGTKKVTTGTYNGAYYVKGVKKVTTGTYNKAYYVKGKKVVTTGLYKEKFYNKGVLNVGLALYKDKLYKDADLNKGLVKYEDKYYFDADLANDTYDDNGVEKAFENGVEVGAKVKSVEAINATKLTVTFNKSVDKDAAEALVKDSTASAIVSLEGFTVTNPTLSEDNKTLTVTYAPKSGTDTELKNATVTVAPVATKADKNAATPKFVKVLSYKDAVAPAVIGTERISSTKVKVKFSEPIAAYTIADFKYADGTAAKVDSVSVAKGSTEATLDLSKADEAKDITVTLVGVQDLAGNIINPNPTTFTVSKTKVDGVLPEVTEIKQTGAKTFTVSFSKKVAKGQVSLNGTAATVAPVTKDAEYDTTFEVTAPAVLGGLYNLGIKGFADIDNQAVKEVTKVFTFTKDEVAPSVVSSKVVVKEDGSKNAEFIELTFDRVVNEGKVTVSGKSVKDYVTSDVTSKEVEAKYAAVKAGETQNKKVLLVKASEFATEEGAAYDVKFDLSKIKSETDVAAKEATVKFVKAKETDVVAENKEVFAKGDITVAPVEQAPSNVKITFSKAVDGASATNVANYNVAGSVVESAVLTQDGTKSVVTLTLKAGSSTFDGARNVTVSNVKVKGSTQVMGTETYVVELKHNILPVLQTASLATTNTVVLTFAKDVTKAELKLYSGKNEVAIATDAEAVSEVPAVTDPDTGDVITPAVPAKAAVKGIEVKGNTVTITTKDAVTAELLKAGLTVSGTVTDANGNALKLVDQPVK